MQFLKGVNKENIMLLNVIYHRPMKENEYKDYLDIVYKDLDTGEKILKTIETPEMEIYFTKEEFRNYDYNKSFLPIDQLESHNCKIKDLQYYIAKQAGGSYIKYYKDNMYSNRRALTNLHKYPYVFGSDYDVENWYRVQWLLNYDNTRPKTVTKVFGDIEVDIINANGFPKDGEHPINAFTIVDDITNTCYTFLLSNPDNPLIQEFVNEIDDFIEDLHSSFDASYGELKYNIFMYDDEKKMLKDSFILLNNLKRDFILFWNIGFDCPYIMDRLKVLGLDPVEIMCHKDFKIKELYFKKDTRNFSMANKGDFFNISSYSIYLDQMILYAGTRKGRSEIRSFNLNYVSKLELGDSKLDYSEETNLKNLPYVNYKKFVKYNIKDVLLQLGLERKIGDVDNVYQRSYTNATTFQKIFKQTVFLVK